jgi:hypothetical protein
MSITNFNKVYNKVNDRVKNINVNFIILQQQA